MKYEELSTLLGATVIFRHSGWSDDEVEQVIASDLMSDVLVRECDKVLLVTSLNTTQALRTADIIGAVGVIVVNNKQSDPDMLALAEELDIGLLNCARDKFETCGLLYQELHRDQ